MKDVSRRRHLAPYRWRCGTKSRVCKKQRRHNQQDHHHHNHNHTYTDQDYRLPQQQPQQQHQPTAAAAAADDPPGSSGRPVSGDLDIAGGAHASRGSGQAPSLSEAEAGCRGPGLGNVSSGGELPAATGATGGAGGCGGIGRWYRWRSLSSVFGGGAAVGELEDESGEVLVFR